MIETNEKLSPLEYRPSLEVPTEKLVGGFSPADLPLFLPEADPDREIGDGLLTEKVEDFLSLKETLEKLLDRLRLELKNENIIVDVRYQEELSKAKALLGLTGETIVLADYEFALNSPENPYCALIIELWENKQEDVDGNLKAELYGDAYELFLEMNHLEDYIQRFIAKKLTGSKSNFKDKEWAKGLLEAEKVFGQTKQAILEKEKETNEALVEAMIFKPETITDVTHIRLENERFETLIKSQSKDLQETYETLNTKLVETEHLLNTLFGGLERKTYEDQNQVLLDLTYLANTPEESNQLLTNASVMLKFSVDLQNEEKHHLKNQLRNTYSLEKRKKLLDTYEADCLIYDECTLDLQTRLNFYDSNQEVNTTRFLNQLTCLMKQNKQDKEMLSQEYFALNLQSAKLREQKIANIYAKDDARQSFQFSQQAKGLIEKKGIPDALTFQTFFN